MVGFALFFWSPHIFVRRIGWVGWLVWLIAISCNSDARQGLYMLKLRLFGFEAVLSLGNGGLDGQNGENMPFEDGNMDQWAAFMAEKGVKIAIPESKIIDFVSKTVTLPTDMGEIVLEIGDKMALGSPSKYVIGKIEGFRQQENGTTVYNYTLNLG